MTMESEATIEWRKIVFLKKVALLQHKTPELFDRHLGVDQSRHFHKGLRYSEIQLQIQNARKFLIEKSTSSRERYIQLTTIRVYDLLTGKTGRTAFITVGGKPSIKRSKRYSRVQYTVNVGWMWKHKVADKIYSNGSTFGKWFVLQADRVRTNNRNIELYEVEIFDLEKNENETQQAYIAFPKQNPKTKTLHSTAATAIKGAEQDLLDHMDELLKGTEHD